MDGKQKREYQTVILGALLHDIGKMLHRGGDEYRGSHEEASLIFLKNKEIKLKNENLYDYALLKEVVRCHDEDITMTSAFERDYFKNMPDEEKKRNWHLVRIVRDADSYSCVERDLKEPRKKGVGREKAPLDSVFSNVNLELNKEIEKEDFRYHINLLNPLLSFPESLKKLEGDEYSEIIGDFQDNIPDCSGLANFEDVINAWMNILEKYTWAVPSDTRYETSDVSLYDHLRSSAAFAACLFKRHINAIEDGKRQLDRHTEFVFIGGDFSGIQDYIFDITNLGSGGAAKRLRARSFFIWLFSEVTIHKILHTLELPIVCNLFSAGGKFLLLAPNVGGIEDKLRLVKAEIQQEIHDTYFNQFSFLMSHSPVKDFKKEFKIYGFFQTADAMFHKLEAEKARKSFDILSNASSGKWNTHAFKASRMYESYQNNGDCKICGKNPGTFSEVNEKGDVVEYCFTCKRDKEYLGAALPKCKYIAFGKGRVNHKDESDGEKIVIFHSGNEDAISSIDTGNRPECYYVQLLEEYKCTNEYYLMYNIGEADKPIESGRLIPIKRYYANHVPTRDKENGKKEILDFTEIAGLSLWQKAEGKDLGKSFGSELLGVLKVDVDNLGLIFSKGFDNPGKAEEGLKDIDRKTVSRYLTMSRMLELFFSGGLKEILSGYHKEAIIDGLTEIEGIDEKRLGNYLKSNVINFNNIYTVYSGGDDMVFVGPWETMIIFSIFLNRQFRKYTCNNKFITLSAGLTFVKPKYPVASAIKQAEMLLAKSKERIIRMKSDDANQNQNKTSREESKDIGKDAITLFGTTIKWDKLPDLINFFLFLDEKLNGENSENSDVKSSNINTSFLHRLLEYHRMALRFLDENKIEGLKYLSALSYDVGRNIVEKDKDGRITKGQKEQEVLQALINKIPDKDSLIYNIKVPLFWALYRNRRASKNEFASNF